MKILHSKGRFYAKTTHGSPELLYRADGDIMSIYYTYVPEADRGRGIAEKLAIASFEYAIKNGLKVRPDCPYIAHFIEKNGRFKKYSV